MSKPVVLTAKSGCLGFLYRYVENDPTNDTDPSGRISLAITDFLLLDAGQIHIVVIVGKVSYDPGYSAFGVNLWLRRPNENVGGQAAMDGPFGVAPDPDGTFRFREMVTTPSITRKDGSMWLRR